MKNARPRVTRDESGIALVLSLFLMLAMSVVGASMMFLSQTETYSSMNYRMMSQARYGAESGIQVASNYIFYTYTRPSTVGPDTLASYNYNGVSPVTRASNGLPVVLSYDATKSNYPYAATATAYRNLFTTAMSLGATNTTRVNYQPTATLVSMDVISAANSVSGVEQVIQTWQVVADGTITGGTRTATVEVSAVLDTQKFSTSSSAVNYGAFATAATCGALQFSGGATTKSYDSGATGFNPAAAISLANGDLQGSCTASGHDSHCNSGSLGTNGNLTESGGATINGTLSTPRVGVGSCSAGNVDAATTSGGATVTGGLVQLPAAVALPTPAIPVVALGTPAGAGSTSLSVTSATTCVNVLAVLPAVSCSGSGAAHNLTIGSVGAVSLGNISVNSTGNLSITSGTYSLGNVSVSSGGTISMGANGNYTMNTVTAGGTLNLGAGGTYVMGATTANSTGMLNFGTTGGTAVDVSMTSLSTSGGGAATMSSGTYKTTSVSISGGTTVTVDATAQVVMNVIQSFTMSGGGALSIPMDSAPPVGTSAATVALNVYNTPSVTTPIDFSGGTVANASMDASRFVIEYGGTGNVKLSGGTKQAEVVYAPNAAATFSGGSALYGEVIAATVVDSGGATIYYDRNLATKGLFAVTKYFPGNPMLSTFTWSKY